MNFDLVVLNLPASWAHPAQKYIENYKHKIKYISFTWKKIDHFSLMRYFTVSSLSKHIKKARNIDSHFSRSTPFLWVSLFFRNWGLGPLSSVFPLVLRFFHTTSQAEALQGLLTKVGKTSGRRAQQRQTAATRPPEFVKVLALWLQDSFLTHRYDVNKQSIRYPQIPHRKDNTWNRGYSYTAEIHGTAGSIHILQRSEKFWCARFRWVRWRQTFLCDSYASWLCHLDWHFAFLCGTKKIENVVS